MKPKFLPQLRGIKRVWFKLMYRANNWWLKQNSCVPFKICRSRCSSSPGNHRWEQIRPVGRPVWIQPSRRFRHPLRNSPIQVGLRNQHGHHHLHLDRHPILDGYLRQHHKLQPLLLSWQISRYIIRQNNRPLELYYDNTLTCPVYHKLTYVFPYCLMLLLREDNSSPVIECVFVKRFPIPDMLQHILNISGVFIHLWVFPWDLNIQFSSTL